MKRRSLTNEEMSTKLVNLYLQEVARLGMKRNLTLDEVINAYYYALHRLSKKEDAMQRMAKSVEKEEQALQHATRKEIVPSASLPPVQETKKLPSGYEVQEEVREETYEEKK